MSVSSDLVLSCRSKSRISFRAPEPEDQTAGSDSVAVEAA